MRAIQKLQILGGGWAVTKVHGHLPAQLIMFQASHLCHGCTCDQVGPTRLVRSVPGELSTDGNSVLTLAQGTGFVSQEQVCQVRICGPPGSTCSSRSPERNAAHAGSGLGAHEGPGGPECPAERWPSPAGPAHPRQQFFWFPCLDASAQASAAA